MTDFLRRLYEFETKAKRPRFVLYCLTYTVCTAYASVGVLLLGQSQSSALYQTAVIAVVIMFVVPVLYCSAQVHAARVSASRNRRRFAARLRAASRRPLSPIFVKDLYLVVAVSITFWLAPLVFSHLSYYVANGFRSLLRTPALLLFILVAADCFVNAIAAVLGRNRPVQSLSDALYRYHSGNTALWFTTVSISYLIGITYAFACIAVGVQEHYIIVGGSLLIVLSLMVIPSIHAATAPDRSVRVLPQYVLWFRSANRLVIPSLVLFASLSAGVAVIRERSAFTEPDLTLFTFHDAILPIANTLAITNELHIDGTSSPEIQAAREFFSVGIHDLKQMSNKSAIEAFRLSIAQHPSASAYLNLGFAWGFDDQFSSAEEAFKSGLDWAQGNPSREAALRLGIVYVYEFRGDYRRALPECETASSLLEKAGNKTLVGLSLSTLSAIYRSVGNLEAAMVAAQRALQAASRRSDLLGAGLAHLVLAQSYESTGLLERAEGEFQESIQTFGLAGSPSLQAAVFDRKGLFYLLSWDRPEAARDSFERANSLALKENDVRGQIEALLGLSMVSTRILDPDRASKEAHRALDLMTEVSIRRRYQGYAFLRLADVEDVRGNESAAVNIYRSAYDSFEGADDTRGLGEALSGMAASHEKQARISEALAEFQQAKAIFDEIGDHAGLTRTEKQIQVLQKQLR
jgi:tetratricopeptide (TPR) repeat protein